MEPVASSVGGSLVDATTFKPHYRWSSTGPRFVGWLVGSQSFDGPHDQSSASASEHQSNQIARVPEHQSAGLGVVSFVFHEGEVDVLFTDFMRALGLTKEAEARERIGIAPETLRTWRKRGDVPLQKRLLMEELVSTARSRA